MQLFGHAVLRTLPTYCLDRPSPPRQRCHWRKQQQVRLQRSRGNTLRPEYPRAHRSLTAKAATPFAGAGPAIHSHSLEETGAADSSRHFAWHSPPPHQTISPCGRKNVAAARGLATSAPRSLTSVAEPSTRSAGLADESRAALFFDFLQCARPRRELQHGSDLPFVELGQQHDLAAGQFQSVVMAIWNRLIDLPEDSGPMSLGWHIR